MNVLYHPSILLWMILYMIVGHPKLDVLYHPSILLWMILNMVVSHPKLNHSILWM